MTITDPTNKTNLEKHSDTQALAVATWLHNKKLEIFRRQPEAAGPTGQREKAPCIRSNRSDEQSDAKVVEGGDEVGHINDAP